MMYDPRQVRSRTAEQAPTQGVRKAVATIVGALP